MTPAVLKPLERQELPLQTLGNWRHHGHERNLAPKPDGRVAGLEIGARDVLELHQVEVPDDGVYLRRILGGERIPVQHAAAGVGVDDHAHRVDVRPVVNGFRVFHLLGGHVVRRAHHHVGLGEHRLRLRAHDLGKAEVGDLHPSLPVHQDVLRLDVAVDHALAVGVLQGVAELGNDPEGLLGGEPPLAHQLAQVDAVDGGEAPRAATQAAGPIRSRSGDSSRRRTWPRRRNTS